MTKAAEQGHPAAQYETGSYYLLPQYPDQNDVKAVYWLRKSAEQGHSLAQHSLGALYYLGRGVPKDLVQAYAWLNLSVFQGNREAIGNRDAIEAMLTDAEFEQAQRLYREYQAKYAAPVSL
jgi:TPR repeat protein